MSRPPSRSSTPPPPSSTTPMTSLPGAGGAEPAGRQRASSSSSTSTSSRRPSDAPETEAAASGQPAADAAQDLPQPAAANATTTYGGYYPPWLRQPPNPDPSYANAPVLSEYLEANFVPSVVPQPEEYAAKEQARQYLEKLADQISPGAKLLPFGSMANGFALKNSDMDLCCFLGKDAPVRAPSELVEQLGTLIERETNFYVKMLPRARIPIIKLNMPATTTIPEGMACDIGFENRLALENTRLLLTYAMIDPRLRTLVLFLKVWTKRRKINNPYRGTLSSYGYVLLVIHFLSHVKQPPVVPNLQRLPLSGTVPLEDLTYEGHDISFFDDLDSLPAVFQAQNVESTGELLIDFFKYFASSFDYTKSVISIRSEKGTLGKEEKGWNSDVEFDPEMIVRDLHKLCIEDPFALDYNVARTVTKDGLYTIRGEFMRAVRILTTTPPRNSQSADRVTAIMNELCAEREDFLLIHPPPDHHKQHQHPHPHTSNLHPTLPISKSPRRRSAPSPQLRPAPPQHPHLHPSPNQQFMHAPVSTVHPGPAGSLQMINGGGGGGQGPEDNVHENGNNHNLHPNPNPNGQRRQHFQPSPLPARGGPASIPAGAQSHVYHPPAPSSVASSVAGESLNDRRSSFDGTHERVPVATSTSLNGNGGGADKRANANGGSTNSYDLHRFFQNPPSSSMSDAGAPSVAPTSTHGRTTVSLTAPSSPDLAPTYLTQYGGYNPGNSYHAGRAPYRYPSSNYPSASIPTNARHASVPRNAHAAHHAYSSPYSGPAYAHNSSSTVSTSNSGTTTPAYPPYPLSSVPGGSTSPAPAPIFPAEDRERIARASSITFGNFPELLPLPSYAHYHASGGSAAYLSGSGGWGINPYGMGGTNSSQPAALESVGPARSTRRVRKSFALSGDEDDEFLEEEEEADDEAYQFAADRSEAGPTRGRMPPSVLTTNGSGGSHGPTPLEHLARVMDAPAEKHPRQRGRSVPQTRMGPDGRESILFGAIEVTLPRPEDVEAAEREEEEKERLADLANESTPEHFEGASETETEAADARPAEETVSPLEATAVSAQTAAADVSRSSETVRSVPTLTTSPPTPAKATPAPPVYACRPLSPLFNAAPAPPAAVDDDEDGFDLDRTPRPASPTRLPDLSPNGASTPSSPSSASDSPRVDTNGLSSLSLSSDPGQSTPTRSKHAAKRARQNERKKVAASQSSTPPPLALTSNSLV